MMNRGRLAISFFILAGISFAQTKPAPSTQPPDISGEWTGTWASYNPAQLQVQPKELCKRIDCIVENKNAIWYATFEGDCGRPYKYVIKMEGRQLGKVVLFKGTADLGEKDGGVYDWIGRAKENEFV